MKPQDLTTNRKALTINLDPQIYGTFAEIGAGQEVARYFFKAGGAAGTVAKSMSAYDMKFSDEIYGKSKRYVSKDRLLRMLEHEYNLLEERLSQDRGEETCFFVFSDTVATQSFKGGNECDGWMGVRFQLTPNSEPSEIIVHVRMLDQSAQAQQDALGVIGVNLIYAAFIYYNDSQTFIESLADNLGSSRIEVDMIGFTGPSFKNIDNRILSLQLVQQGLTNAVMFGPDNTVLQPSETVYKKALLVERGSFRPVTNVNIDMFECAGAQFIQEPRVQGEQILFLMEITMNNLLATGVDLDDFLARIDIISSLGYNVLISNYPEYYRLSAYFRQYTQKMIGIVLGINHLLAIFNEAYYQKLDGGILEACGRLFKENIKLYVYPMKASAFNQYAQLDTKGSYTHAAFPTDQHDVLINAENIQIKSNLRHLFTYLKENHFIEPISGFNSECLNIFSREVFKKIKNDDPSWEKTVPPLVAEIIKERKLWHSNSYITSKD